MRNNYDFHAWVEYKITVEKSLAISCIVKNRLRYNMTTPSLVIYQRKINVCVYRTFFQMFTTEEVRGKNLKILFPL